MGDKTQDPRALHYLRFKMHVYYLRDGGNSFIEKNTGHIVWEEELNTFAPSAFIRRVMLVGTLWNPPGDVSPVYALPSHTSLLHPS